MASPRHADARPPLRPHGPTVRPRPSGARHRQAFGPPGRQASGLVRGAVRCGAVRRPRLGRGPGGAGRGVNCLKPQRLMYGCSRAGSAAVCASQALILPVMRCGVRPTRGARRGPQGPARGPARRPARRGGAGRALFEAVRRAGWPAAARGNCSSMIQLVRVGFLRGPWGRRGASAARAGVALV